MKLNIELDLSGPEFADKPKVAIGNIISQALATIEIVDGAEIVPLMSKDKKLIGEMEIVS